MSDLDDDPEAPPVYSARPDLARLRDLIEALTPLHNAIQQSLSTIVSLLCFILLILGLIAYKLW